MLELQEYALLAGLHQQLGASIEAASLRGLLAAQQAEIEVRLRFQRRRAGSLCQPDAVRSRGASLSRGTPSYT